mgnify:CR=1 FL=1
MQNEVNLKDFEVVNQVKWESAIKGSRGVLGVGDNASDMEKLAAYDKLGGLIRKNGAALKTGSFYDFEKKAPRQKPEIVYVFPQNHPVEPREVVEIPEGEEIPMEILAKEIGRVKKEKGEKKTKKKKVEDEE